MARTLIERIGAKSKADSNGCWIWQGALNGGKPVISWRSRVMLVRRALALEAGMSPDFESRSLCGVKLCVHPEHWASVKPAAQSEEQQSVSD